MSRNRYISETKGGTFKIYVMTPGVNGKIPKKAEVCGQLRYEFLAL